VHIGLFVRRWDVWEYKVKRFGDGMEYEKMLNGFEIVREYVGKLDAYLGGGQGGGKLCLYVDDYELYHRMFVKPYVYWVNLRRCLISVGFRDVFKDVVIMHAGEDHLCLAAFGVAFGVDEQMRGCVCDYTVSTGKIFCLRRQDSCGEWKMQSFANELEMLNVFVSAVRDFGIWNAEVDKLEGLLNAVQKDLSEWWGAQE